MTAASPPQHERPPIWLWALVGLAAAAVVACFISIVATWHTPVGPRWGFRGLTLLPSVVFFAAGALILARHPRHRIAWILTGAGLISLTQTLLDEYAIHALIVSPGRLPGAQQVVWLLNWIWVLIIVPMVTLLPLYFPDGRLPSRGWSWVAVLAIVGSVIMVLAQGFMPGPYGSTFMLLENPYGLPGAGGALGALFGVGFLIVLAGALGGAASLVWRFRRSGGAQRQQIKWFAYAAGLMTVVLPLTSTDVPLLHVVVVVVMLGLPAAIVAAILRHRLYDIDILVNRTLVYAVLSASLGLVYLASVLILQGLFQTITGEGQPEIVTVLSTLAMAALFSPLRQRVQAVIDQRFYRSKYNANLALQAFAQTLRDEASIDLPTLGERMAGVVHDTMQPRYVSLWLRPDTAAAERRAAQLAPEGDR